VLLAPAPPMLFMGEEYGATTPFLYFCDFEGELAGAVTRGRRSEFGQFERFRDAEAQAAIPDPNATSTFLASKLDRGEAATPNGAQWLEFYRHCLALRRTQVAPRLHGAAAGGTFAIRDDTLLSVSWRLGDGATLHLGANFAPAPVRRQAAMPGVAVFESDKGIAAGGPWPAYAVCFTIEGSG
jgi:1,4-alpha-glucan branching enzyme